MAQTGAVAGLDITDAPDAPTHAQVHDLEGTFTRPTDLETVSLGADTFVFLADSAAGGLNGYLLTQGAPAQPVALNGALSDFELYGAVKLETAHVDGTQFLLALDQGQASVLAYEIAPDTGALTLADQYGAAQGLGLAAPVAFETVQSFDRTFIVIADAVTSTLSVMALAADGALQPTDHVIDTGGTRFGGVQSVAVAQLGERIFVVAGGADDGLSLFTLLPNGLLHHLQSIPSEINTGLMNVGEIEAIITNDILQVFASSDEDGGLAQFSVSLADLGDVIMGDMTQGDLLNGTAQDDVVMAKGLETDSLFGGAGDDILVTGVGDAVLTGGQGADVFVLSGGDHTLTITDFNTADDRIDMSDFAMLRSPAQLETFALDGGMTLAFRDTTVNIYSDDGLDLSLSDVFEPRFSWADRLLMPELDVRVLSGTAGADMFEIVTDMQLQTVIDFQRGRDQLDISNFADISGPDQISVSLMADGIKVGVADVYVTVEASDGAPLALTDLFDASFFPEVVAPLKAVVARSAPGPQIEMFVPDVYVIDLDDPMTPQTRLQAPKDGSFIPGTGEADLISGSTSGDNIWSQNGDDIILGAGGSDVLGGGQGLDTLFGGSGDDVLFGGSDRDWLDGGDGADRVWAGLGDDVLLGRDGDDQIGGSLGDDTIWAGIGDDLVFGDIGNDTLSGNDGRDTLWAGPQDDIAFGGAGDDRMGGGTGDDALYGQDGNEIMFGGQGADAIFGQNGFDILYAGPGHDWLDGGDGDDVLSGGGGDDILTGGAGHDVFGFGYGQGEDIIMDFTQGDDAMHLYTGDITLSELTILGDTNGDAVIRMGVGSITVLDIAPNDLTEDDFVFL